MDFHGAPKFSFQQKPSLTAEDAEMLAKMERAQKRVIRGFMETVERELITRLEILLGRVPSDDEIRTRAKCVVSVLGASSYLWDGEEILRVGPIWKPSFTPIIP